MKNKTTWMRFGCNGLFHAVVGKRVACNSYRNKKPWRHGPDIEQLVAAPLDPDQKCLACEDVLAGVTSWNDRKRDYARAIRTGIRAVEKHKNDWLGVQVQAVLREQGKLLQNMFKVDGLEFFAPRAEGAPLRNDGNDDVVLFVTAPPGLPQVDTPDIDMLETVIAELRLPDPESDDVCEYGTLKSVDGRVVETFNDARSFRRSLCLLLKHGNTGRLLLDLVKRYRADRRRLLKNARSLMKGT